MTLAERLASLPKDERDRLIKGLTPAQATEIMYDWRGAFARPNQLPPEGDWTYWLLLAGRGFGKTRTGAETVREWASKPLPGPIHMVAPTAADIRKVMIEGPGGLMSCYPDGQKPLYEPSKGHKITWQNGNVAYCFSADEPERLRGPQCAKAWLDEVAAWRFMDEAWDNMVFGFRLGDDLRCVITTTPKPVKLIRDLVSNPATHVTRGSTYDNRLNLGAKFFKDVIRKYEGTRIGRQELLAEVLEDIPGALWTQAMIDAGRIQQHDVRWNLIQRVVVAIDPAVTVGEDSDETGIVVAALTVSHHVIILEDCSLRDTALNWARAAVAAYQRWKCDRIIGEVNNGGDLVEGNIRAVAPHVPYRGVRATRGKAKRAEPVASLYEQGRVHHMGHFPELEKQMCEYTPADEGKRHDDRMDALVWAVHELLIDQEEGQVAVVMNDPREYRISPV